MKRKIILILAFLVLLNQNILYAAEEKVLTPEEIAEEERIKQEELERKKKEAWEKAVNKVKDYSTDDLTTAYLLGDFASGKILEFKNIDEPVAIASISKIISIYVVMDEISKGNISKNDIVRIDKETAAIRGSSYDLKEGMEVKVEDLIIASLVVSGNDAVTALSKYVAGTESNFVIMMEKKLDELGIKNFKIVNSSGLPDYENEVQNMMTVRGLFILSRSIIKDYPEILEYTKIKEIDEKNREFKSENTNPILGEIPEVDGLKTGYTGLAGRCMIATGMQKEIENERADMRLIGITMGSKSDSSRYVAIKKLMNHGFSDYEYRILGDINSPIEMYQDENAIPEEFGLYTEKSVSILSSTEDSISISKEIFDYTLPIKQGEQIGEVTYYLNGEEKLKTSLIVKEEIKETSLVSRLNRLYKELFEKVQIALNGV